jgi:formamidase
VKNVDLSQVHYLSGPISVEGAQPGDLLKVEFLNLGPLDDDEWGFTGTFAKENGGGFLTDHFPKATKACWDIDGIYCTRFVSTILVRLDRLVASVTSHSTNLLLSHPVSLFVFILPFCCSRHIPGVRFAGLIHPGLIGTAPR